MTAPEIIRLSTDVTGGQARMWVSHEFVVSVINGVPLIVPPRRWDGPTMAAFGQALTEASAHCPETPQRKEEP